MFSDLPVPDPDPLVGGMDPDPSFSHNCVERTAKNACKINFSKKLYFWTEDVFVEKICEQIFLHP
jgi:hypothetical protein